MKLKIISIVLMILATVFIVGGINKVEAATVTSFTIRVSTVDYNTGAKTTNSQYSMEIPGYGVVTTYNMGTVGSDYKTGYTSNGTYTLRQTQRSTGGYAVMSDIKLTISRDSQGRVTNVTSNNSSVNVTWSNGSTVEVNVTIRERKATTTQDTFNASISTSDKSTNATTTGGSYTLTSPSGSSNYYYTIGSTNTRTINWSSDKGTIYTLKQTNPSSGYNRLSDTLIYVYTETDGRIYYASSNNSDVTVSYTSSSISISVKETKSSYQTTFSMTLRTTDKDTSSAISGASYRIKDVWSGAYKYYDIGSSGSVTNSGFYSPTSATTYTFVIEQTKNSTNYNNFGNITLYVTFNSSGVITNAYTNSSNVAVSYTSSSVTITTRETRTTSTQNSFNASISTSDKSTNATTTGGSYTLTSPSGSSNYYYTIGSTNTRTINWSSDKGTLYTLKQTNPSSGYNRLADTLIYIYTDSNGRIYSASSNNSDVTVSYTSSSISISVKETKSSYQTTFSMTLRTTDKDTSSAISGASYRIKDVWSGAYKYYDIGSSGSVTNSGFYSPSSATTYTFVIEQTKNSTNYNNFGNITLYVTFNSSGVITNAYTNSSNVAVSYTSSSVTITTRETRTTSTQNSFNASISTSDKSTNATTTGGSYTLTSPSGSSNYYYTIGSTNTRTINWSSDKGTTYRLKQTAPSSGYTQFSDTYIYVYTYDTGKIYYASSSNSDVTVSYTESSISITVKETRSTTTPPTPVPGNISFGLTTVNAANGSIVTGGTFVVYPPTGNGVTYTIGSSGSASNTFTPLSAGTYIYTIRQTALSTGCDPVATIELEVTYNSNGLITNVSKKSGSIGGTYNSTSINLQILEIKGNTTNPIVPETSFALSLTTQDYTSGSRTTGAKFTLKAPNGNTLDYDMGTTGSATKSNIAALAAGTHAYTLTQTVNSNGYNKLMDIIINITFDSTGKITNVVAVNADVIINSYSNNSVSITIKERKVENNFSISISTPAYSSGVTFIMQTPTGETKNFVINNGTAKNDFKAPGVGRYTYKIQNAYSVTGSSADMNLYVTFDAAGKITSVSTDSSYISGNYDSSNISVYVTR